MKTCYYDDPYQTKLRTRVVSVRSEENALWVEPEATIVYPGGGGQQADRAVLGGYTVSDIRQYGHAAYRIDQNASLKEGDSIEIKIDGAFRYYNMQQHTGQHLISAVLDKAGCPTESVHLGEHYTLVEVSGSYLPDQRMRVIEEECNQLIRSALPVKTYYLSADEASKIPLRKIPPGHERLRIVQLGEIDYSACGGTHVRNSAEIGLCLITGREKIRGNQRLQVLFGRAAYAWTRAARELEKELNQSLQCSPAEMPDRVKGLIAEKVNLQKQNNFLGSAWAEAFAKTEAGFVLQLDENFAGQAMQLAKNRAADGKSVCVLCDGRFYFAGDENSFNMRDFIHAEGAGFGMRGGGPAGLIQGVYDKAREEQLIEKLNAAFSSA